MKEADRINLLQSLVANEFNIVSEYYAPDESFKYLHCSFCV